MKSADLRVFFTLTIVAAWLGAAQSFAQGSAASQAAPSQNMSLEHLQSATTLGHIHHINQKEIKAAELALKKSNSPDVKSFAQRMIRDHQSADAKVTNLAANENIELKDFQPADWEQAQTDQLSSLTGPAFDQAYLAAMKSGHKSALEDLKLSEASATDPRVKNLIKALIPTVEEHEALAAKDFRSTQAMAGSSGQSPSELQSDINFER